MYDSETCGMAGKGKRYGYIPFINFFLFLSLCWWYWRTAAKHITLSLETGGNLVQFAFLWSVYLSKK
jgi:hypothetical protein